MDNSEIEFLRSEVERLRKVLEDKQQITNPPTSLIDNAEFVADCCRYAEGIFSKQDVKRKWHFADDTIWTKLAKDEALIEAIDAEKLRRIRSGQAKREKAQSLVVKTPEILDSIATDKSASPRHRVDAIKTLDGMSDTGPRATPEMGERFSIVINLGEDYKLRVDKSIGITPNDKDVEIIDNTPQEAITDGSDR
jgi:hypothetical protein